MRILFIDIDTLRPDHLGCYGYQRNTSPNIDRVAALGVRFENCYVSDAPCLPSRSGLWSGRTGFHTGVIDHGGIAADPFHQGPTRGFRDIYDDTSWIPQLRRLGLHTVTVSPFGERHSAWWWYAGWLEVLNPGKGGVESADDVTPLALDWIEQNAQKENWFLHVNYWDPHTPYRTPLEFGNPFENDPAPAWITEDVLREQWAGYGPHSAQESLGAEEYISGHAREVVEQYPREPFQIDSMEAVKRCIDGYDTGIRYADEHVGRLLAALQVQGVLDDTIIIISSDHGENLGELNVWSDHQTADNITCRVPLIIRWPGMPGARVDSALHYHFDWVATMLELLGGQVPANWDAQSFAPVFRAGHAQGREFVVVSQGAWACQRGVRFDYEGEPYLCMRTYHDGYKQMEPVMLWNLARDPHEQHDLAAESPDLVNHALRLLENWLSEMMITSLSDVDPMMTVLREGGSHHTRGMLPAYLERLRATGREQNAEILAHRHPDELAPGGA